VERNVRKRVSGKGYELPFKIRIGLRLGHVLHQVGEALPLLLQDSADLLAVLLGRLPRAA
jgi:hypothetical protein